MIEANLWPLEGEQGFKLEQCFQRKMYVPHQFEQTYHWKRLYL